MRLIHNKKFKWSITAKRFLKASLALVIALGAVKYGQNQYYLALVPFLLAIDNIIGNRK